MNNEHTSQTPDTAQHADTEPEIISEEELELEELYRALEALVEPEALSQVEEGERKSYSFYQAGVEILLNDNLENPNTLATLYKCIGTSVLARLPEGLLAQHCIERMLVKRAAIGFTASSGEVTVAGVPFLTFKGEWSSILGVLFELAENETASLEEIIQRITGREDLPEEERDTFLHSLYRLEEYLRHRAFFSREIHFLTIQDTTPGELRWGLASHFQIKRNNAVPARQ